MIELPCQVCGVYFTAKRCDAKTCSPACRQQRSRKGKPHNRTTSPTQARDENEFLSLHDEYCHQYYTMPPAHRPVFLHGLIKLAQEGDKRITRLLTNLKLLRASPKGPRNLFYRGSPQYPTLAQEAHAFSKWYYDAGIRYVIENPGHRPPKSLKEGRGSMGEKTFRKQVRHATKNLKENVTHRPSHTYLAYINALLHIPRPSLDFEHAERWGINIEEFEAQLKAHRQSPF